MYNTGYATLLRTPIRQECKPKFQGRRGSSLKLVSNRGIIYSATRANHSARPVKRTALKGVNFESREPTTRGARAGRRRDGTWQTTAWYASTPPIPHTLALAGPSPAPNSSSCPSWAVREMFLSLFSVPARASALRASFVFRPQKIFSLNLHLYTKFPRCGKKIDWN